MAQYNAVPLPNTWLRAAPTTEVGSARNWQWHDVTNPANRDEVVGQVALCTLEDVDQAVGVAQAVFPPWRDLSAIERGKMILAGVAQLEQHVDELATLIAHEVGKPLADARGEVLGSIHLLKSFVDLVRDLEDTIDVTGVEGSGQADRVLIRHVPVGPVAVIGPWNTPLFLAFNGIAPSLASGCTVVVKPPVEAPLALTATVHLLAAMLPAGVLQVVTGRGSIVGQRLAEHEKIRAVMFTGGTETGRTIAACAANTIKKVALELGGNDAAIVLDDATIDDALIDEMMAACFSVSGQVCFNVKRIYVHRSLYESFVEKFATAVDRLTVGDPFDEHTIFGPMTTAEGYENALRLIDLARSAGGEVRSLGQRSPSAKWDSGYYIAPTLVLDLPRDHELVLEEQFAPIIPIIAVDSVEEAVSEANRTEFGLASSVWSSNINRAVDVAARIEAGNTYINTHRLGASVPAVPFGGIKQSGLGRTHGMYSLHHCTEEHAIVAFSDPSTQLPGIDPWQAQRTLN